MNASQGINGAAWKWSYKFGDGCEEYCQSWDIVVTQLSSPQDPRGCSLHPWKRSGPLGPEAFQHIILSWWWGQFESWRLWPGHWKHCSYCMHVRDMYYMCTYNFWMVLTLLIFSVALTPPGSGAEGQICSSIAEANLFGQMIDMYCLGLIFFMLCCPFSSDRKRDKVLMQYN